MDLNIRDYHPSDICLLYEICLKTGKSGKDATKIYSDPYLLGHFYVAPYLFFESDVTFILTKNEVPVGYIVGSKNSNEFEIRCEKEWFPILRKKYPLPFEDDKSADSVIIRRIHEGYRHYPELDKYPAHLHIDILPEGQGKGMGKKLIDTFQKRLIELEVRGLHLEVGKKNENAVNFYKHIGFHTIFEKEYSYLLGKLF